MQTVVKHRDPFWFETICWSHFKDNSRFANWNYWNCRESRLNNQLGITSIGFRMFVWGQSTVAWWKRSGAAFATSVGRGRDYTSKVNVQHCCRCSCCCRCCCCCYCCIWRKSFLATLLLQSLGVEWGTVRLPPPPSLASCHNFLPVHISFESKKFALPFWRLICIGVANLAIVVIRRRCRRPEPRLIGGSVPAQRPIQSRPATMTRTVR